jgi:TIR domain
MIGPLGAQLAPFVFVSYSRSDRAYVDRLVEYLQEQSIMVWYDYEIATGDRFDRVITRQIDDCAAMVVVMSAASMESDWVANELTYAQRIGKQVLPLLLSGELIISLASREYEDVRGRRMPSTQFVQKLRRRLASPAGADGNIPRCI